MQETISPGMRGFIATCFRNQESRCISEFYDLFNKVFDEQQATASVDAQTHENFDFETALKTEVKDMKGKKQNILAIRNDVKGVVFFKATSDLDVDIIFEKLIECVVNKTWKPKHVRRLLPVQTVTSASIAELEKGLRRIKVDKEDVKTFSILVESRLNQSISKKVALDLAVQVVSKGLQVDLTRPDLCFFIEIIKNACCIGVVKKFYDNRKYNLVELYSAACLNPENGNDCKEDFAYSH